MANRISTTVSASGHIAVTDGQPTTTTQDIADVYGKRHDDVLRIVRKRMAEAGDWGIRNFTDTPYTNPQNGQTYPVIRMTKKGFHFVVGKFTGAKAVAHQIAFADEFERMESALQARAATGPDVAYISTGEPGLDDLHLQQIEGVIKHLRARHDLSAKMLRDAVLSRMGAPSFAHIPRSRFQDAISVLREFAPAPNGPGAQGRANNPIPTLKNKRWLIECDHNGQEQVSPIPFGAIILQNDDLPEMVRARNFPLSNEVLLELATACLERVAKYRRPALPSVDQLTQTDLQAKATALAAFRQHQKSPLAQLVYLLSPSLSPTELADIAEQATTCLLTETFFAKVPA